MHVQFSFFVEATMGVTRLDTATVVQTIISIIHLQLHYSSLHNSTVVVDAVKVKLDGDNYGRTRQTPTTVEDVLDKTWFSGELNDRQGQVLGKRE